MMKLRDIRNKLKKIALLEAALCQEWGCRYYSYNSKWSIGEEMASMRDGCGNEWFLWITDSHAAFKIFSKDDGRIANIPEVASKYADVYKSFLAENAFSIDVSTQFGFYTDADFETVGLAVNYLLTPLQVALWERSDYFKWAMAYYEIEIDDGIQIRIWDKPFDCDIAKVINKEFDNDQFRKDIDEISYDA